MTILKEKTLSESKYDIVKAERFAQYCTDLIKEKYILSDIEQIALYRFLMLTFCFLYEECYIDEYTADSVIKLIKTEVDGDYGYEKGEQTVFTIIIDDVIGKYPLLDMFRNMYLQQRQFLPRNAVEMLEYAFDQLEGKLDQ